MKNKSYALGGLATARRGILNKEGHDMANKKHQRDDKKADTDGDGQLSAYEKTKADAVQQATLDDEILDVPGFAEGGMPIGATEAEVADDLPAKLSEGEYVLPAHVVKWHGLKYIQQLQDEAEMGLMCMQEEGLIKDHSDGEEEPSSEDLEDTEVSASDDPEQEEAEEEIETPEGTEIEVADVTVEEEETPELAENEEDYAAMGITKKARFVFIT